MSARFDDGIRARQDAFRQLVYLATAGYRVHATVTFPSPQHPFAAVVRLAGFDDNPLEAESVAFEASATENEVRRALTEAVGRIVARHTGPGKSHGKTAMIREYTARQVAAGCTVAWFSASAAAAGEPSELGRYQAQVREVVDATLRSQPDLTWTVNFGGPDPHGATVRISDPETGAELSVRLLPNEGESAVHNRLLVLALSVRQEAGRLAAEKTRGASGYEKASPSGDQMVAIDGNQRFADQFRAITIGTEEQADAEFGHGSLLSTVVKRALAPHFGKVPALPSGLAHWDARTVELGRPVLWKDSYDPRGAAAPDGLDDEDDDCEEEPLWTLAEIERVVREQAASFNPAISVVVDTIHMEHYGRDAPDFRVWVHLGPHEVSFEVSERDDALEELAGNALDDLCALAGRDYRPVGSR